MIASRATTRAMNAAATTFTRVLGATGVVGGSADCTVRTVTVAAPLSVRGATSFTASVRCAATELAIAYACSGSAEEAATSSTTVFDGVVTAICELSCASDCVRPSSVITGCSTRSVVASSANESIWP